MPRLSAVRVWRADKASHDELANHRGQVPKVIPGQLEVALGIYNNLFTLVIMEQWGKYRGGLTWWWLRPCSRARRWSTCSWGTAGWTGSAGSSSVSGARRRTSSRSGRSGRTGIFSTSTAVTRTWGGFWRGCWSRSPRTGAIWPSVRSSTVWSKSKKPVILRRSWMKWNVCWKMPSTCHENSLGQRWCWLSSNALHWTRCWGMTRFIGYSHASRVLSRYQKSWDPTGSA